ncbi:MAG: TadE/TadG family type IV pilus assembly protein [bacterium]|nr:TadE/TadG family type IV pilus assembly protein [bacterium]
MTLETVVVFPAVILLIFGLIQGAFYLHASNVARSAASAAVRAASAQSATEADGHSAAQRFLEQTGGNSTLVGAAVSVARGGETVTATVTGHSPSLVPGIDFGLISRSATAPVERWVEWTAP